MMTTTITVTPRRAMTIKIMRTIMAMTITETMTTTMLMTIKTTDDVMPKAVTMMTTSEYLIALLLQVQGRDGGRYLVQG